MIGSARHNGQHPNKPNGYGVKISAADQDEWIDPGWRAVRLVLDNSKEITIHLTPSFWRKCYEFRSVDIGRWFIDTGIARWPKGEPARIVLEQLDDAKFSARVARSR